MGVRLKIKEIAERRGINKAQLSRRADIGTTTVHELWEGTRENVTLETLAKIARVLGVRVVDLIEEYEEEEIQMTLRVA